MTGAGLHVDVVVRRGDFVATVGFEADRGETIGLLGPNGAGKSTVVAAIAGLEPPSGGAIVLGGVVLDDATTHLEPERRPIGVVFQDLLLFPHLTALENVAFPLRARGIDRASARERAASLLERLGVAGRGRARPRALSGGEAQRVALARALVGEPTLLLLDEPLSALDASVRTGVRELLRDELARFPGVRVLVTHDPVEATTLADRLVLLEDGRVTQVGTPEEVRAAPRSRYAADLVGVNAFRGKLEMHDGTASVAVDGHGEIVVVPATAIVPGADVIAIVRPTDVTLSLEPPSGTSARNAFAGDVRSIASDGVRARVRLSTDPPLVAEVTAPSLSRLGIAEGTTVWASFKAVEVELLEP